MAHHHFLALGLKIDTSERFTDVVFLDNYFDIPVQERLFHNNHRVSLLQMHTCSGSGNRHCYSLNFLNWPAGTRNEYLRVSTVGLFLAT